MISRNRLKGSDFCSISEVTKIFVRILLLYSCSSICDFLDSLVLAIISFANFLTYKYVFSLLCRFSVCRCCSGGGISVCLEISRLRKFATCGISQPALFISLFCSAFSPSYNPSSPAPPLIFQVFFLASHLIGI